jgi:aminoglycoside phosphotransferase (APT) family kinase protein
MRDTTPTDSIDAMVQQIEPAWTVRESSKAVGGSHLVYKLRVDTGDGERRCVLKVTPEEADAVCGDEARLFAVLNAHSAVSVPELHGVVDEDDTLPAPFFFAEEVPGANYRRDELASLGAGTLEQAATSLGRQLAGLHRTTMEDPLTLDGYGFVDVDRGDTLEGSCPESHPGRIVVEDAELDWKEYLRGTVEHVTGVLTDTRFAGMADELEPVLTNRISSLSGPFSPALCRVDHSIENTVLDPDTHEVRALLDWEFCVAATPAYDIAFAVHSLSGGLRTLIPAEPDWRGRIETALLEGYEAAGGEEVVQQYQENGDCYQLLSAMHGMANFDDWFDRSTATNSQREAAVDPLRERTRERMKTCRRDG